jgi:hypothetical protein
MHHASIHTQGPARPSLWEAVWNNGCGRGAAHGNGPKSITNVVMLDVGCWKMCRRLSPRTFTHTISHRRSLGKCDAKTCEQKFVRLISVNVTFWKHAFMRAWRTQRGPANVLEAFPLSLEKGNAMFGRSLWYWPEPVVCVGPGPQEGPMKNTRGRARTTRVRGWA